jgi:hypothetical protein
VLERHYTSSAFITSSGTGTGLKGEFNTPAEDLSLERFAKTLSAHVATQA